MKISAVNLDGFGALRDFHVDLVPGINLFVGNNEAGKSTLQQAIMALLYGFYHKPHVAQVERALHERFRPWGGEAYSGTIEYALDSGRTFRIQRSFETDAIPTSVVDLATGRDLVPELGQGRHGNVPVALVHLGVGPDVFLSTCFLSQASMATISAAGAVSEAIVGIADTAGADASAEQAVQRLEAAILQVGTSRAGGKPLPAARDGLQRAKLEIERLDADYVLAQSRAAEKEECEAQLQRLLSHQRLNTYHVVSKRLQEVEGTLSALHDNDAVLSCHEDQAEALAGFAGFPRETRDTVLAQKGRLDALLEQKEYLEAELGPWTRETDTLRRQVQELRQQIETMEFARGFALEKEEEFNRLRFSLEHSLERKALEQSEEAEADRSLSPRNPHPVRNAGLVLGLVLAAAACAWLAISGNGVAALVLGLALALGTTAFFRHKPSAGARTNSREPGRVGSHGGVRSFDLESQLMAFLSEAGIRTESVTSGIESFQRRLAAARELGNQEKELATLEEKLKGLLGARQRLADVANQVNEAENALLMTLGRAGIAGSDLSASLGSFEDHYNRSAAYDGVLENIRNCKDRRKAILGSRTEAMLIAQRDALQAEELAALTAAPELSGASTEEDLTALEREASRLAREVAALRETRTRLEASVQEVLGKHRPRAEIEEDLAQFKEEVIRLLRFSSALTLAKNMLKEASEEVHRDFAPRLARSLSEGLSHITDGRYDSAFVDPKDFTIRLQSSDHGNIVHIGHLSTGTREQAYLLLRVELARTLSSNRESLPLIMDDPFVNFDEMRLRKTMELLAEISQKHQVLLFTKDASAVQWLGDPSKDPAAISVHHLHAPRSYVQDGGVPL